MPQYFFHVFCDSPVEGDRVAIEFPSLEAAIEDAKQARLEMLRDEDMDCRIDIADEEGRLFAQVPPLDS